MYIVTGEKISKELIALGKQQGYLTCEDISEILPDHLLCDAEILEDLLEECRANEIVVGVESEVREQRREGTKPKDPVLEDHAADDQRSVDPVSQYMRSISNTPLLDHEGEVVIAKLIERGLEQAIAAAARFPGTVNLVLAEADRVAKEGGSFHQVLFCRSAQEDVSASHGNATVARTQGSAAVDSAEVVEGVEAVSAGSAGKRPPVQGELPPQCTALREILATVTRAVRVHGRDSGGVQRSLDERVLASWMEASCWQYLFSMKWIAQKPPIHPLSMTR